MFLEKPCNQRLKKPLLGLNFFQIKPLHDGHCDLVVEEFSLDIDLYYFSL